MLVLHCVGRGERAKADRESVYCLIFIVSDGIWVCVVNKVAINIVAID